MSTCGAKRKMSTTRQTYTPSTQAAAVRFKHVVRSMAGSSAPGPLSDRRPGRIVKLRICIGDGNVFIGESLSLSASQQCIMSMTNV